MASRGHNVSADDVYTRNILENIHHTIVNKDNDERVW